MQPPTAALIVIGNEILSGRTQDKNIAYLAAELSAIGIPLMEVRVIPDISGVIVQTICSMRDAFTYLFTTGGIGPTHDDITTAAVAEAFNVQVIRHADAERALRAHYTPDQINAARLKMADVPEGATLIHNPVSAAPGYVIGNVHVLAGVPRIMQAMFDALRPILRGGEPVTSLSVTTDLPEGTLADGLSAIQGRYPATDIGSYPYFRQGGFFTTLVVRSSLSEQNMQALQEIRDLIHALGGQETLPPGAGM